MSQTTRLEIARKQIEFARTYTLSLLEDIDDGDWFRRPGDVATHVAWQIGHLAMAEYGLVLFRQRGRRSAAAAERWWGGSMRGRFVVDNRMDLLHTARLLLGSGG